MSREIKFEYGFQSQNGIVKKVYHLSEIPNIKEKCDVWGVLPIAYVREFAGIKDKHGRDIYEGMKIKHYHKVHIQIDESDKKEFDEFECTDIGTVIFENGCFLFYAENEHGGSVTTTLETYDEFAEYTFEIIEEG